jgi:malonyl CoA-acyl carrier protein transacylase
MSGRRLTAVVVCPGRGAYGKGELGSIARLHGDKAALFDAFDARRRAAGQETLRALDSAAAYDPALHTRGDTASALIYALSYADWRSISAHIDIVAVTGNSMGWYTALACAGAVSAEAGFDIVNTMGALMQQTLIGGQTLYPFVGEDWRPDLARKAALLGLVAEINTRRGCALALSIDLGGMLVLAGNEPGLAAFEAAAPPLQGRFPMRLANHAAFHTALQADVAALGRQALPASLFGQPKHALIDGRGAVWRPHACDPQALWRYTLDTQVVEPYDFTRAVTVAAREFAPEVFIVLGPGTTLGGAVAQSLIIADWRGLRDKADFMARQADQPVMLSMGMADQRAKVTAVG